MMAAGVGGEKLGFVAIPGEILKLDWPWEGVILNEPSEYPSLRET